MLFATNRTFIQGPSRTRNPQFPRSVDFNLDDNQAGQSISFCRRNHTNSYTEIGHSAFFDALEADPAEEILFYIHGYSTLPEPVIFSRTEELQQHFNALGGKSIRVVPLIWPCDNDSGPLQDYFGDQMSADASDIAFMRFFEWFFSWLSNRNDGQNAPFSKNLNILSHSMGARVLRGAINRAVQYFQVDGFPLIFRSIFLSASDIVNEALEAGEEGQWIPSSARNIAVYYASDDWALRTTAIINIGNMVASRRLGQKGPENMNALPDNVFAFDCGDFNNRYDLPGHGYFASDDQGNPGLVLRHMHATMQRGRIITPNGQRNVVLDSSLVTFN